MMDYSSLRQYIEILKSKLIHKRLSRFAQLDIQLFVCKVNHNESLVIALGNGSPRIYLGPSKLEGSSLSTTFSSLLRKNYSNALVEDIRLINEDRIVCFDLTTTNEVFKQVRSQWIIELLPSKPNFILLEEGKILYGLKMTTLDDPRPIVKGLSYEPPLKKGSAANETPFKENAYLERCLAEEDTLIASWRKRRYLALYIKAKNLKKSANRALIYLEEDLKKAESHLHDAELGTLLLTYASELDCSSGEVDIDGFKIKVDPRKSPSGNAEGYFRSYKKAKATIARIDENRKRVEKELEEALAIEMALDYGDEETLQELLSAYSKTKKGHSPAPSAYLPYQIYYGQTRILLGKNAAQNDFLTFHFSKNKAYYWVHVKDQAGAHVIIEDEHPSDALLQFACEAAVAFSGLTSGEVQYCPRANLRKGKTKGQVILGAYQSTLIRAVSSETKKAMEGLDRLVIRH